MMQAVLNLKQQDVPRRTRDALGRIPGLQVVPAPASALVTEAGVRSVAIETVRLGDVVRLLDEGPRKDCVLLALIEGVLDTDTAIRLEDAGIGYVDAADSGWLPDLPRTRRTRPVEADGSARRRLGPASLRAAQLLADHPHRSWSEPDLGRRAEVGHSTAHNLLSRLERDGLLERHGRGRTAGRRVVDPRALRHWLIERGHPGRTLRLACFVPDPTTLPSEIDGVALVRSGAGAAEALGLAVIFGTTRPLLRVALSGDAFESLPARLDGFRTDSGANVLLISDPHRLACSDARRSQTGALLAPPSRVAMDLYLEPRGDAAAQVFLDLWGDREL